RGEVITRVAPVFLTFGITFSLSDGCWDVYVPNQCIFVILKIKPRFYNWTRRFGFLFQRKTLFFTIQRRNLFSSTCCFWIIHHSLVRTIQL
ncbi:hypothetical protein J4Q44_G00139160, partial [Coregonus suidteri]